MTPFRPLDFGRTLDADGDLNVHEYAILNAMARGTDNNTFQVRRSLANIAEAAKVRRQTVGEVIKRPKVSRYFAKVERRSRRVDIWLRQEPEHVRGTDMETRGSGPEDVRPADMAPEVDVITHGRPTDMECAPDEHDMCAPRTPSALSTSYLPSKEVEPNHRDIEAPCFCIGEERCEDCVPDRCWDHGGEYPKAKCEYCRNIASQEISASRHPDWKQKQWHDTALANEGLNEYGEPLGLDY